MNHMISTNRTLALTEYLKLLSIAEKYSELPNLSKILRSCCIYPIRSSEAKLKTFSKTWCDSYNNKILIDKNKLIITPYKLRFYMNSMDMYAYLNFNDCVKITNRILIAEFINLNVLYVSCYCIDKITRSFFIDKEIIRTSPIFLNYNLLDTLINNVIITQDKINIPDVLLDDEVSYVCCNYPFTISNELIEKFNNII